MTKKMHTTIRWNVFATELKYTNLDSHIHFYSSLIRPGSEAVCKKPLLKQIKFERNDKSFSGLKTS